MPRVRKIEKNPFPQKNYFVVDACFLANKYITPQNAPAGWERERIKKCREWWAEIDRQLKKGSARVYIPDICIAETFKVFAKKYFKEKWIIKAADLNRIRNRFREEITIPARSLQGSKRIIKYHDISTSRDIIIAVDRFYESFLKKDIDVSLPDLIILATAKYLIDFFDVPKKYLHIITLDSDLHKGSKKIQELPNAYDPTNKWDRFERIFR